MAWISAVNMDALSGKRHFPPIWERPTPGDPWGVEQHHWNTGAEETKPTQNPGISRCRSQHISVESSSLLHHSIYL